MAKTRAQRKAERRARAQRPAREAQRSRDADSRAEDKISRRARRREEKERERRRRESAKRREAPTQPTKERQRGRVIAFFISCWAELKRVQWPDRDTLIQASAVTILFIAIAAAYLGALDSLFNFLVQHLL